MTPLERVRSLCLSHPGTMEKTSHGEPAWFIEKGKQFAMFADHHHDDQVNLWCAALAGVQAILVESAPDQYFVPPYVGVRGWVGIRLEAEGLDWDEVAEIIRDGYRSVAPTRLLRTIDPPGV